MAWGTRLGPTRDDGFLRDVENREVLRLNHRPVEERVNLFEYRHDRGQDQEPVP